MDASATRVLLRNTDHATIFRTLWHDGSQTLKQLATNTALALPLLNQVVDDFLQGNLIQIEPHEEDEAIVSLRPNAAYVIGIDIGGTRVTAAVMDLAGQEQHAIEARWDELPRKHEHDLEPLFTIISQLLAKCPGPVLGIGVGAPGVTHPRSGIVSWAPGPRWRDLPLRDLLEQRFQIPTIVENDVNLATLGELHFGAGQRKRHFICIMIGTGIGSGVVIDGSLYRGAHHAAGEVGYMVPSVDFLNGSYISFGALESVASGTGIARQAAVARAKSEDNHNSNAEEVFQLAADGEAWASTIVDQTGRYLAQMIANVCALLDPECIVLGGGVTRDVSQLLGTIRHYLSNVLPIIPEIVPSQMGSYAAVRGAIKLVIDEVTSNTR